MSKQLLVLAVLPIVSWGHTLYSQTIAWHSLQELPLPGVEVTQLAPSDFQDSLIYGIGTEQGEHILFHSSDLGHNWDFHSIPELTSINSIAIRSQISGNDFIYVAGKSGVWGSQDKGVTWIQLDESKGGYHYGTLDIKGDTIVASTTKGGESDDSVLYSYDGGSTWQVQSFPSKIEGGINTIKISPNNSGLLYVLADSCKKLFLTTIGSDAWKQVDTPWAMGVSIVDVQFLDNSSYRWGQVHKRILVILTSGQIYYYDNSEDTWYQSTNRETTQFLDFGKLNSNGAYILQNLQVPNVVYICVPNQGIWGSRDGGKQFKYLSNQFKYNQTDKVYSCTISSDGHQIFLGGSQGISIFYLQLNPSHSDWRRFYPLAVGNLWVYTYDDLGQRWTVKTRVIGDTNVLGNEWFILKDDNFKGQEYARIDSNGVIYKLSHDLKQQKRWLQFNVAEWDTFPDFFLPRQPEYYWEVIEIASDEVIKTPNSSDLLITFYQDYFVYTILQFQENIGLVYEKSEGQIFGELNGAYIDGTLYGDTVKLTNSIEPKYSQIQDYAIVQNYPNPFNDRTKFSFSMIPEGQKGLYIYDTNGRYVSTIFNNLTSIENKAYYWDGTNAFGIEVPSGVYVYVLVVSGKPIASWKMIKLK